MNMQELEEASGLPLRMIRFLIGKEIVPRPQGGKRFAEYGEEHLRALRIYSAAKSEGVESLDVIRMRVEAGELPVSYDVADGIELRIVEGSVPDIESFLKAVRKLAIEAKSKKKSRKGKRNGNSGQEN